jgi:hypothetical protein
VRVDRLLAVVAQTPSGRDRRDLIELALRATRRGEHGLDRLAQRLRCALDAQVMRRHHRDYPLLERVELRHEVGSRGDPLTRGNQVEGLVKAAAATSAIVIAGAGVGARVVHSIEAPAPAHHHHKVATHPAASASAASIEPTTVAGGLTSTRMPTAPHAATPARAKHHSTPPPSHDLEYLALGGSTGGGTAPQKPVAVTANTHPSGYVEESPPPSRSGGGSNLNYLGK